MFSELLNDRLGGIVNLSWEQVAALEAHYELMLHWNEKLNLTTITSVDQAVERHYCESLFLGAHLPAGALRLADVGSGAGFPGFPIAILRPECLLTLVESHQRKAVFLNEASRHIPNTRVVARRAEELTETFDRVIARGVSYEDLRASLKNLAPAADLLTGVEEPPSLGFEWGRPILLPWGRARFLRSGRLVGSCFT